VPVKIILKPKKFNLKLQPLFACVSKPLPAVWGTQAEESAKYLYSFTCGKPPSKKEITLCIIASLILLQNL